MSTPTPDSVAEIIRGFEVTRWNGATWEQVAHFRPTELAVRQAAADLKWHRERHPNDLYELRALISIPRRDNAASDVDSRPITLDADVDAATAAPVLEPEEK